jgi:hypothetical protein
MNHQPDMFVVEGLQPDATAYDLNPPPVHDIREWAITHYFNENLLDTAARFFYALGEDAAAYNRAIDYLCASARSAPAWIKANVCKVCWWETTDMLVKLWPNPRAYGDPPIVTFQLSELAELALARAHNISREQAAGQGQLL